MTAADGVPAVGGPTTGGPAAGGPAVGGPVGGVGKRLGRRFYERDSTEVAPALLNKLLVSADGRAARLIEVEAYRGTDDPASHSYRGRTTRNSVMWGPAGHLYVYFSYGQHFCANVVTGPDGVAQAVLLRAAEPVAGVDLMRLARWRDQKRQVDRDLCRGPGRLAEAFGLGRGEDGLDLAGGGGGGVGGSGGALWLADDGTPPPERPATGPRVGISVALERPWRYWVAGHPGVSGSRGP